MTPEGINPGADEAAKNERHLPSREEVRESMKPQIEQMVKEQRDAIYEKEGDASITKEQKRLSDSRISKEKLDTLEFTPGKKYRYEKVTGKFRSAFNAGTDNKINFYNNNGEKVAYGHWSDGSTLSSAYIVIGGGTEEVRSIRINLPENEDDFVQTVIKTIDIELPNQGE